MPWGRVGEEVIVAIGDEPTGSVEEELSRKAKSRSTSSIER